jgi:hypothetical protein
VVRTMTGFAPSVIKLKMYCTSSLAAIVLRAFGKLLVLPPLPFCRLSICGFVLYLGLTVPRRRFAPPSSLGYCGISGSAETPKSSTKLLNRME